MRIHSLLLFFLSFTFISVLPLHAEITFEKITLSTNFYGEGADAGDVNQDGYMDVVSGPYWYAGPTFDARHEYRPVKAFNPLNYSDSFLTHVDDYDGDGWDDILVVGWPGYKADHEHKWFQNPQQKDAAADSEAPDGHAHWEGHLAFKVVDNEGPHLHDIDGDGRRDLIYHTLGRLGYASPNPEAPTEPWTFTPVSPPLGLQRYTHGIGAGDITGDGKPEFFLAKTWWERPADPTKKAWIRHDHAFASPRGGAQIHAFDIDGDGDNDVVSSLHGHGYGLAWHEQTRDGDTIHFTQHDIMGDSPNDHKHGVCFSQLHALDVADINADGLPDLITGKRWWAHGPKKDPGAADPAVLYWWELQRDDDGARFVPHQIDDNSGVGCQVTAKDISGDGKPDVIVGNKKGTFVFIQK